MQDALDQVRREMGADAVILNTKQVPGKKRWLPFGKAPQEVVITAGLGITTNASTQRTPKRRAEPPAMPAMSRQEQRAAEIVRELSRKNLPSAFTSTGSLDFTTPDSADELPTNFTGSHAPAPLPGESRFNDPTEQLVKRLDQLQRSIERIDRSRGTEASPFSEVQQDLYQSLLDGDVAPEIAKQVIAGLSGGTYEQLEPQVRRRIEQRLRCTQPIQMTPGRRKVVALVGATGVGKTTTIAKLAANFRLSEGARMGLVTVDTFRIAAVEQLKTYAEIIELPMKVVTDAAQMRQALDDFSGMDLVFIDTAGRSPRDAAQIENLRHMLEAAQVDEVHQVVSLTSSRKSLLTSVERFAPVGVTSLIVSKLDEAEGAGGLLSVSQASGLPIGYFTTGQGVPDDIEPARASVIADLILNAEFVK
ncbi:Flagellar biosynthesis protein FlhF [Calycomorphotria hydatis]|uniref:Flagellar biosynthesis protein FlhF n=2 Tax=Calycomorphotria hydatis TaxID=2528027 RepID=A0A517TEG3_9PLAN|nr:Flagellar biosynthesis protein FlhF [Calycomorphotria hydatis]